LQKAAQHPEDFDTAIVFTTHYVSPSLQRYLVSHPDGRISRMAGAKPDLSPAEIATILHGQIVWQSQNLNGEWAAVLRFNRSYEAFVPLAPAGLIP
jgi:hypothetical protein